MGREDQERQNQSGGEAKDARRREEIQESRKALSDMKRVQESGGWRVAHLKDVNVEELTDEDILMYLSIRNGTISGKEEFERYKEKFVDSEGEPKEGVSRSTVNFIQFLDTQTRLLLLRREREEKEREKRKGKKD